MCGVAMTPLVAVGVPGGGRTLGGADLFFGWLAACDRSSSNQSGAVATVGLKLSFDTGPET